MPSHIKPNQILDVKGRSCPEPILETKRAVNELSSGQILKVLATDPSSKSDISAWARRTGNELLEITEEEGVFIYYIRKR